MGCAQGRRKLEEGGGGGVTGSQSIEGEKNCVRNFCVNLNASRCSLLSPHAVFTSLLPSCSPRCCHCVHLTIAIVFTSLLPSCSPHHCHHVHLVASVFTSLLPVCSPHCCRHVHLAFAIMLTVAIMFTSLLRWIPCITSHHCTIYPCTCVFVR